MFLLCRAHPFQHPSRNIWNIQPRGKRSEKRVVIEPRGCENLWRNFNVPQLKKYSERKEACGLEYSSNQGTFDKSKYSSDFGSLSNHGTLKTSSAPRIPTTTGEPTELARNVKNSRLRLGILPTFHHD
ncbi:hypothetical protein N431DRAFT_194415 [Stipitochalara longipes BDJ]|nr:hypothetical protein N431DRAFT_194415 [Stipitochalara longipes BDJ]